MAERASAEIREHFKDAEVELIRGGKGIFDVIDQDSGAMVFSKYKVGRHANPGELVALLQAR